MPVAIHAAAAASPHKRRLSPIVLCPTDFPVSSPCLAITDLSATTVSNTRNFSNREPTLNGDRRLFQSSPRFFESFSFFFFFFNLVGRTTTNSLSLSYANRRDSSRIRPNNWIVHEFHPPRFLRNELLSKLCVADNFRDCRCARVGKNEEDALFAQYFCFQPAQFFPRDTVSLCPENYT